MRSTVSRSLLLPTLAILAGCSYNQVSAQSTTPIPQSLVEAAERSSQSSMALADIMARAHGQSVRSVSLEVPSTSIPEFMMQRVRLDYNGPQAQVLQRVAADTGYRVVEYNEPASGIGWQPWIRLSGDKPLVQHFKEMNSQSPWHLILDHRDRRIVVDYSADGSMASQVANAQRSLGDNQQFSASRPNLPDTSYISDSADQQISRDVSSAPESAAQQAAPLPVQRAAPRPTWKNDLPMPGKGYWHALISGYASQDRASQMKEWVGAHSYQAVIVPRGDLFDVHLPALDDGQASEIREYLSAQGVPAEVKYRASSDSMNVQEQAQSAINAQSVAPSPAQTSRTSSMNHIYSDQADLDPSKWYVQTAYVATEEKAIQVQEIHSFDHLGDYRAYPLRSKWVVRIGPLASRSAALDTMRTVRSSGVSDAYAVKGLYL